MPGVGLNFYVEINVSIVEKQRHQQKNCRGSMRDVKKVFIHCTDNFIYIRKQFLLKVKPLTTSLNSK